MPKRSNASGSIRAWAREPLLHFLILGGGLFLLFRAVDDPGIDAENRIVVTTGQIEHLVTIFSKTRYRPPTPQELQGLIDDYILEEVLYRQAVALGLDRDDTIIRRRLKQKMEFLVDDLSSIEPTEDDLQQFLSENETDYREEARVDFEHVYFKAKTNNTIEQVRAQLQDGTTKDVDALGDRLSLPSRLIDATESQISGLFGETFTDELLACETSKWTGPIASAYGVHLIRIDRKIDGRIPTMLEIRDELTRDWRYAHQRKTQKAMFEQLRSQFTIIVESAKEPEP